jgi:hypothetical protein
MNTRAINFANVGVAASHEAPAPMANQAVHDTVVSIVQDLLRGKLFDVPAGEGRAIN